MREINHPIIVGAGQCVYRQKIVGEELGALDLAVQAVLEGVNNTGCSGLLNHVDSVVLVNMFKRDWDSLNP